jgi:hypothetical protein
MPEGQLHSTDEAVLLSSDNACLQAYTLVKNLPLFMKEKKRYDVL